MLDFTINAFNVFLSLIGMSEFTQREYVNVGREFIMWNESGNPALENAAMDFFADKNYLIQRAIKDRNNWKSRPGKAYKKKEAGIVWVPGSDQEDIKLQLAKCYTDPRIEIPGVPSHNHPDYSEFFAYPIGEGKLILGFEENKPEKEIDIYPGIFTFIDGRVYHAVVPSDKKNPVYVAILRFDPELIENFTERNRLELL